MLENQELIFWVDVETTGLNPNTSALLQVAAIVTDIDGNELAQPFERVIFHTDVEALREETIPFVQEMHDATGLWARLPEGDALTIVDKELLEYLMDVSPKRRQARLAGSSCRLDLNFLEAFLPETYSHLHYRSIDVSALAYALEQWGVVPGYYSKKSTHNAVDDIRESLDEYRWIREKLKGQT